MILFFFFPWGMRHEEQNIAQNASIYISLENIVNGSEKKTNKKPDTRKSLIGANILYCIFKNVMRIALLTCRCCTCGNYPCIEAITDYHAFSSTFPLLVYTLQNSKQPILAIVP